MRPKNGNFFKFRDTNSEKSLFRILSEASPIIKQVFFLKFSGIYNIRQIEVV